MSTTTYELTVTLLTDLHAGSGLGGADVDAILERDARGLPTVRWTHLRGLLQQALVDRERALGRGKVVDLLHELFGAPVRFGEASGRGQVRGTSLRLRKGDAAKLKVYSSTARDRKSRVPRDDTLRRVEYLQAGTVLSGKIQAPADLKLLHLAYEDKSATRLIETLLRRTDSLGKNRTRGDGRIHLKAEAIHPRADVATPIQGSEAPVAGWQHYRLAFRALDPLCLGVTLAPGNLIPGTSFLNPTGTFGMLGAAARRDHEAVAAMIFDGRIEAGASYPLGSPEEFDVTRVDALPIPLSYQTPKPGGQADEWPWWMVDAAPATLQDVLASKPEHKLKRPGPNAYLVTDDGGASWRRHEAHLGTRLRNNAGEVQRGFREKELFSQEEIPEDTVFVCHLRVRADHANAPKDFEDWLTERIKQKEWLFAGRGGTPVQIEQACRIALPRAENPDPLRIRLYVETDLIARRGSQSFHAQLDRECLVDLLDASGINVRPETIANVDSQSEPVTVHGFNVMTGEKRLSAIAIRRGSVAVLTMKDEGEAKALRGALAPLQFQGLGERCGEGYGRFRLDFAPAVDNKAKSPEEPGTTPAEEVMLRAVSELLGKHDECLTPAHGFSTTRLHALRHAASNDASFDAWFEAAARAVKQAEKANSGQPLLDAIKAQRTKAADANKQVADAALKVLERFAVEAAKMVQAKRWAERGTKQKGKKS